MSGARVVRNPMARPGPAAQEPSRAPLDVHRRLPGYAPTRLVDAPSLASALGVGRVWVKDEAHRLGLPAFKMLGASWAVYRAVSERLGEDPEPWADVEDLARRVARLRPMALAAATDGNHGRAVARMARLLGFEARIFVPSGTTRARIEAIAAEGATVAVVDAGYDETVARSAEEAGERCLVVSDTSWPGYETVPGWVIEGYATIFWEIEDELAAAGAAWPPDVVAVQVGVGAFAAAAVRHVRRDGLRRRSVVVGVEPVSAACATASVEAGRVATLPHPQDSIMAGLNCGTPSIVAWPDVSAGVDWFVTIEDEDARGAMRGLADAGVVSGESGAAGLAGLLEIAAGRSAAHLKTEVGLTAGASVLVISTEGATDPDAYRAIVGRDAEPNGSAAVEATPPR